MVQIAAVTDADDANVLMGAAPQTRVCHDRVSATRAME